MTSKRFGQLLKARRRAGTDPTTGASYTQQRIADEATRISGLPIGRSGVASWENGTGRPSTAHINALTRIAGLEISAEEAMAAIGVDFERLPLSDEERELLAAFRRLRQSPAVQAQAIRLLHALRPPPGE